MYVNKDAKGNIIGKAMRPQLGWTNEEVAEAVDLHIPDDLKAEAVLREKDREMARVVEDLIDVLVAAGVISRNDLPQQAQDLINERVNLRATIGQG